MSKSPPPSKPSNGSKPRPLSGPSPATSGSASKATRPSAANDVRPFATSKSRPVDDRPARPQPTSKMTSSPSRPEPRSSEPRSKEITIPREELEFTYARSSGAGGQNVNKVNSKAILRWNPQSSVAMSGSMRERFFQKFGSRLTNEGVLILMSDVHRDQGRNAAECMDKLKEMIKSIAVPPKKRVATRPTFGSKVRRLNSKKVQSDKKQGRRNRGDD